MRLNVIHRDQHCVVCKRNSSLHVHHAYDKSTYPRHCLTARYLVTMCNTCHRDFHVWNGGYKASCTPSDLKRWAKR